MQYLFYIWIAGIIIGLLYECWKFSQNIKLLTSTASFLFMVLEVIRSGVKYTLWPVLFPIYILQLPFAKAVVDETNDILAEFNGYDLEDEDEDGKD